MKYKLAQIWQVFCLVTVKYCKVNMKGDIGRNFSILGVDPDSYEFYLMFLSLETDIKQCQMYTKT